MRRRPSNVGSWIAAGSALIASGIDTQAFAGHRDRERTDLGVYFGATFGAGQRRIGWGLEARRYRMSRELHGCDGGHDSSRFTAGIARVGWLGWKTPHLLVGAQAGEMNLGGTSIAGELDIGHRFGANAGPQVQFGGEASAIHFLFNTQARVDPVRAEASWNLGWRSPPHPIVECFSIAGRPRRDADGIAALPSAHFLDMDARGDLERQCLAQRWTERARVEWASVPSFLELAAQLRALDAPHGLIRRAVEASLDEVRHAILSAHFAALARGTTIRLDGLDVGSRPLLAGQQGLDRLAIESWTDGCVGEGSASATAELSAAISEDPATSVAQRRIAFDERRHAALAWDVLEWSLRGGADPGVFGGERERGTGDARVEDVDGPDLTSWGMLPPHIERALRERERKSAAERLAVLLADCRSC